MSQMKTEGSESTGRIMTINEAADLLSMCRDTVLKLVQLGDIPASNIAPRGAKKAAWRILEDELMAWFQSRKNRK